MRVVGADGDELPWDGESAGELHVRGPWVARSYHDDDRSAESFSVDGWLKTGDVVVIDHRGFVTIVDRIKDVVKSGGEWISSVAIENLLADHPDVAEAAVIGIPDDRWGERPMACVVLAPGAEVTAADLADHLDGSIPRWWIPDRWEFLDEIPRTTLGKFSKIALREAYA